MSISTSRYLCEDSSVNTVLPLGRTVLDRTRRTSRTGRTRRTRSLCVLWLAVAVSGVFAQTTNPPAATNAPAPAAPTEAPATPPNKLDESAFSLIGERNIFNANRSGGKVQLATRRPTRVETFTLVGTMAYEKGAFAFFEGSSSKFTKAVKADGIIAGHKLADIYAGSVKLEADGKQIELPIGSQMRREDAGTWQVAAVAAGSSSEGESSGSSSRRNGDSYSRRNGESSSRRSTTSEPAGKAPASGAPPAADQSEILKRLMERREKE